MDVLIKIFIPDVFSIQDSDSVQWTSRGYAVGFDCQNVSIAIPISIAIPSETGRGDHIC